MDEVNRDPGAGEVEDDASGSDAVGMAADSADEEVAATEDTPAEEYTGEELTGDMPAGDEMPGEIAAIEESLGESDEHLTEDAPSLDGAPAEYGIPAEGELPGGEDVDDIEALPPVDLGPEQQSRTWVWVLVAAIALLIVGAVGYGWWYLTARPIAVPQVVGKLSAPAVQTLNDAGLRLGKVSEIPTDSAPIGTVVEQTPVASTTLSPGDPVSIIVAAAPEGAEVPDVTGKTADQAKAALAAARLAAFTIESFTPSGTVGTVVRQLPPAGVDLPPGTVVALAVSKGAAPATIRVPQVVGLKETDAKQLLDASDLQYFGYRSFNASVAAGVVMTQSPTADALIPYDGVVQYAVSNGAGVGAATVPNVVGQKESSAEKAIKERGLKPQTRRVSSASVAKGKVIGQMPLANSTTAKGATVGILISKGAPTSAPVPDLTGLASAEASKTVRSAGFTPIFIDIATTEHPSGQVWGQYPDPGVSWFLRLPIIAIVAP